MGPVHGNKVDGTVPAIAFQQGAAVGQKANELVSTEFTGSLGKFAMTNFSFPGNVAVNSNIIWWVDENDVARPSPIKCSKAVWDVASPQSRR